MFPGLECHSSGLSKESLLFSGFSSQSSPPNRASKCGSALAATFINWWFMLIKRVAQENGIVCFDISFCSVIMIQGYIRSYTIIILSWDRHCTCHIFKSRHCHVHPGALPRKGCAGCISKSTKRVCKPPSFLHREQLREKTLRSFWLHREWPDSQEGGNLKIEANVAGVYLRCLPPRSNLFIHDDSKRFMGWFKFSRTHWELHYLPTWWSTDTQASHIPIRFSIPFPFPPSALLLSCLQWGLKQWPHTR